MPIIDRRRALPRGLNVLLVVCLATAAAGQDAKTPSGEAEARRYADRMLTALVSGERQAIDKLIDWDVIIKSAYPDALLRKLGYGLGGGRKLRASAAAGMTDAVYEEAGLISHLIAGAGDGSLRVLRTQVVKGHPRVVFRGIGEDVGILYVGFDLRGDPGNTRAVEIFLPHSGSSVSRMINSLGADLLPPKRSLLARLLGSKDTTKADRESVFRIATALRAGKYKEALALHSKLPKRLQEKKSVMLMRVRSATEVGDEEFNAAVAAFRRALPKDPSVDLLSIDVHLINERYDQALAAVDRVDVSVGGDPYLKVIRANIVMASGDAKRARAFALAAHQEEPDLEEAVYALVDIGMGTKNYVDVIRWIGVLRKIYTFDVDEWLAGDVFKEFRASEEYRKWQRLKLTRRKGGK